MLNKLSNTCYYRKHIDSKTYLISRMIHNPTIVFFLSLLISLPAWANDRSLVPETTEYIVYYSLVSHPKNKDPFLKLYTDLKSENQAVDYQKSLFPHKDHQRRLLTRFMGNKEESCRVCHHNKHRGKDPQRCTACHTTGFALRSLLKKQGRDLMFKGATRSQGFLGKDSGGKMLGLIDAYHALCNGCHMTTRGKNPELWGQQKKAPIMCEGCHRIR